MERAKGRTSSLQSPRYDVENGLVLPVLNSVTVTSRTTPSWPTEEAASSSACHFLLKILLSKIRVDRLGKTKCFSNLLGISVHTAAA